jgi:hypothetical protein
MRKLLLKLLFACAAFTPAASQGRYAITLANGTLPMPTGVARTGIFNTGEDYYLAPGQNFNTVEGVDPGDYIVLESGSYGHINIQGTFDDLWIMGPPSGMAYVNSFGFGDFGLNVHIIENPAANGVKTLTITNAAYDYFAINCRSTGRIIFRNFNITDAEMGIQVETRIEDIANYRAAYQTLTITGIDINGTNQEGMYIGADTYSTIPITWYIANNTVSNTGRDGIQVRNGSGTVENNSGSNIGLNEDSNHGHGILYGTGSTGCIIRNNTFTNIFYYGALINGFGNITFTGNTLEAGNSGFYFINYAGEQDYEGVGHQTLTLVGNTFTGVPVAIDCRRDPAKNPMTLTLGSNTLTGTEYIEEALEETYPGSGIWRGGITVTRL